MRWSQLILAAVLVAVVLGAYLYFYQQHEALERVQKAVIELKDRFARAFGAGEKEAEPAAAASPARPPASGPPGATPRPEAAAGIRKTCPRCNGEGRVAWSQPRVASRVRVRTAGAGADTSGGADEGETVQHYCNCPACGGAGYRLLKIPEGAYVCPTCGGMGKVAATGTGRPYGRICKRCNGTGWIMPRDKTM